MLTTLISVTNCRYRWSITSEMTVLNHTKLIPNYTSGARFSKVDISWTGV